MKTTLARVLSRRPGNVDKTEFRVALHSLNSTIVPGVPFVNAPFRAPPKLDKLADFKPPIDTAL